MGSVWLEERSRTDPKWRLILGVLAIGVAAAVAFDIYIGLTVPATGLVAGSGIAFILVFAARMVWGTEDGPGGEQLPPGPSEKFSRDSWRFWE